MFIFPFTVPLCPGIFTRSTGGDDCHYIPVRFCSAFIPELCLFLHLPSTFCGRIRPTLSLLVHSHCSIVCDSDDLDTFLILPFAGVVRFCTYMVCSFPGDSSSVIRHSSTTLFSIHGRYIFSVVVTLLFGDFILHFPRSFLPAILLLFCCSVLAGILTGSVHVLVFPVTFVPALLTYYVFPTCRTFTVTSHSISFLRYIPGIRSLLLLVIIPFCLFVVGERASVFDLVRFML